jgi:N6-adenosine-specific RNA methylase IME4
MPRKPMGKVAMTSTERSRQRRALLRRDKLLAPKIEKQRIKRERRARRELELTTATARVSTLLGRQLYAVISCDPPWRTIVWSRETGMDRAADNHYPTMTEAELFALRLPAAPNCVLFLWTTIPHAAIAYRLLAHWGFVYKSQHVWVKPDLGTGFWIRERHEILLIAVRGEIPCPAPGTQYPSAIEAPRGEPSEKPDVFAEMIESYFPNVPKLEMFARRARSGWDVWGNEVAAGESMMPATAPAA